MSNYYKYNINIFIYIYNSLKDICDEVELSGMNFIDVEMIPRMPCHQIVNKYN